MFVGSTYLGIAGLETKMEEPSNTILCSSRRVVHDEAKALHGQSS